MNPYRLDRFGLTKALLGMCPEAELLIKHAKGEVSIIVQDEGRGFVKPSENSDSSNGGFGLIGIAERLRMLGGT